MVVAFVGGLIAFCKWRDDVAYKRAVQFRELLSSIHSDVDMTKAIYVLDDDEKEWFNENYVNSDQAGPIDKLLFHFCNVIYLSDKMMGKKEMRPLLYELERSLHNPQLQDYLYNLQKYSEEKGLVSPFECLVEYGLGKGILDSQFDSNASNKDEKKKYNFHSYYKMWIKKEKEYAEKNY